MKQTKNFFLFALVAMFAITLSSCDSDSYFYGPDGYYNDSDIAYDLRGYWVGAMDHDSYRSYDVEFYFAYSSSNRGTGIAREYDSYNRYEEYSIRYEVIDGYIYIDYEDGYRVKIYRYTLDRYGTSGYLDGIFDDNNSIRSKRIRLRRNGGW